MAPSAHLLISWLSSVEIFRGRRERVLVTLSGVAPDLDGLGFIVDLLTGRTTYYIDYHHYLGHNIFTALVFSALVFAFSRTQRYLAFAFSLLAFHLHIVCDVVGSRGPDGYPWPIYYLYPYDPAFSFIWSGQWALTAWQNQAVLLSCLLLCLYYVHARQVTFFELFGSRFDSTATQMYNRLLRRRV